MFIGVIGFANFWLCDTAFTPTVEKIHAGDSGVNCLTPGMHEAIGAKEKSQSLCKVESDHETFASPPPQSPVKSQVKMLPSRGEMTPLQQM